MYWDNGKENGNYYLSLDPKPCFRMRSFCMFWSVTSCRSVWGAGRTASNLSKVSFCNTDASEEQLEQVLFSIITITITIAIAITITIIIVIVIVTTHKL